MVILFELWCTMLYKLAVVASFNILAYIWFSFLVGVFAKYYIRWITSPKYVNNPNASIFSLWNFKYSTAERNTTKTEVEIYWSYSFKDTVIDFLHSGQLMLIVCLLMSVMAIFFFCCKMINLLDEVKFFVRCFWINSDFNFFLLLSNQTSWSISMG